MGVIIYRFNLNISPKRSYGVLEGDIALLQNPMLAIFVVKRLRSKWGVICAAPCTWATAPLHCVCPARRGGSTLQPAGVDVPFASRRPVGPADMQPVLGPWFREEFPHQCDSVCFIG